MILKIIKKNQFLIIVSVIWYAISIKYHKCVLNAHEWYNTQVRIV